MKAFKEIHLDNINRYYKEHCGNLIKKYRSVFGKYIFVVDENGKKSKVYVGKFIYQDTKLGSILTIGEINGKLINIRSDICKNNDK